MSRTRIVALIVDAWRLEVPNNVPLLKCNDSCNYCHYLTVSYFTTTTRNGSNMCIPPGYNAYQKRTFYPSIKNGGYNKFDNFVRLFRMLVYFYEVLGSFWILV